MAQGKGRDRANPRSELREDKLVERLIGDPSKPTEAKVLFGYLGRSDRAGRWRLYSTPELGNDYVEFRTDDFLYSEQLDAGDSGLGGSVVWLTVDAEVTATQSTSRQMQAAFLEGDVTSRFVGEAEVDDLLAGQNVAILGTIIRITVRLTRKLVSRRSICGPCSKPSLCNLCLPP